MLRRQVARHRQFRIRSGLLVTRPAQLLLTWLHVAPERDQERVRAEIDGPIGCKVVRPIGEALVGAIVVRRAGPEGGERGDALRFVPGSVRDARAAFSAQRIALRR